MKRILYYIVLVAAATACNAVESNLSLNGDASVSGAKMITEVISGSSGTSTKATIDDADASFKWTKGENLAVHVSSANDHKYVVTSSGASDDAATAAFEVTYEEGYSRDAFAVFPSTIVAADAENYGQDGDSLDVTLPGRYTLAEIMGETTPCPMIATNVAGSNWTFYQLCGLLRLTVNGIPSSSKRLEIDFDGKKVWGDFSIANPVPRESVIALPANPTDADKAKDIITITKDGTDVALGKTSMVVNIPLPVGTYTSFTVTAYDAITDGNVTLVLTRPFAYTASNQYGTKRTASFPSSKTAYRGYEVSTGILLRSQDGSNPATYSLTSGAMNLTADPVSGAEYYALPAGCNPFEPAVNYKQSSSLNTYFLKWLVLRGELGANGNNIKATSDKLPAGWQFPSAGGSQHATGNDWGNILFGAPKSDIYVNGTKVANNAFALVKVSLGTDNGYSVSAGDYYGILLLRDGSTIPEGYLKKLGYGIKYTENPLTETQFNDLVRMGCLFISASGYYSDNFGWRELNATYQYGYYWSNTYYSESSFYFLDFEESGIVSVATQSNSGHKHYQVVKLVKPVVD